MAKPSKLVKDCNALARKLYDDGFEVPRGYRFDLASHPQESSAWDQAVIAYEHVLGKAATKELRKPGALLLEG